TRGNAEEGEPAPQEDRGLVQGDPQGGADPDPRRAPRVPRARTEGDEGHRGHRLAGLDFRAIRARGGREGEADGGGSRARLAEGREETREREEEARREERGSEGREEGGAEEERR